MSVKKKPLVVVTRKLPDSIETRMRELFDARLNLDDTPMTPEQLAKLDDQKKKQLAKVNNRRAATAPS